MLIILLLIEFNSGLMVVVLIKVSVMRIVFCILGLELRVFINFLRVGVVMELS